MTTLLILGRAGTRTRLTCCGLATTARFLSTTTTDGPLPVNVEHYTSGWCIDDISDFTKPGKYNIMTYNKISPKVRSLDLYYHRPVGFNNVQDTTYLCRSLPHAHLRRRLEMIGFGFTTSC